MTCMQPSGFSGTFLSSKAEEILSRDQKFLVRQSLTLDKS